MLLLATPLGPCRGLNAPLSGPPSRNVVYQITGVHGGRRDTWKYGITSGTPGKRPALGLANCGARWTGCRVRILHWTMGYWAARRIERSYVFRYRYLHGHCPLGQISSCK